MKYFEIKAKINSHFENVKAINKSENATLNEVKESNYDNVRILKKYTNNGVEKGFESKPGRSYMNIDRRWRELVERINDDILNQNFENFSLIAKKMDLRDVYFILRTEEDSYKDSLKVASKLVKSYIDMYNDTILFTGENNQRPRAVSRILAKVSDEKNNDSEEMPKEIYDSVSVATKEITFRDYYFVGLKQAENFGLDVSDFLDHVGDNFVWCGSFEYERVKHYFIEYVIEKKLTKDEYRKEYKDLLLNKSFKAEIDRIYNSKNEYNVAINPVHYELIDYDENDRDKRAKALAVALYSNNRIKSNKYYKLRIDIMNSYFNNDVIYMILNNTKDSFLFLDFTVDHDRRSWNKGYYYGRTNIRTNELTDNILNLKDKVQFAFYIDKYQDKVRDSIYDELNALNIVTFDEKIAPEKVLSYVKELAKNENVEVTDKLINMVKMSQDDMTLKDAKDVFDNYKDELVKTKYFPEYKNYFNGTGNVDNFIDPYEELMHMPGLTNVKNIINDIICFHKIDAFKREHMIENKTLEGVRASKYDGNSLSSMNMIFMGNPGTCKTTVAKLVAKILKSKGIIKNDRTEFFGVDGRCEHIENAFKYAYGGVLFIDEAYSLPGFIIDELVALMENHRKDVIVILAGYTKDMNSFLRANQGLKSRFKYLVEFEDYTEDELWDILNFQAKEQNYILEDGVIDMVMPIFTTAQCDKEMGNGRLVRNMLEMAIMNQASRFKDEKLDSESFDVSSLNVLKVEDFDIDPKRLTGHAMPKIIGNIDPEKELDNMIGLTNVKNMIKKCISSAHMAKVRKEKFGQTTKNFISTPMHLAFLGNPGTAKTTVARLVARILKKKGIIKKDTIVEVGRKDLVGQFVGSTAPRVQSIFNSAKGGVLFIDEAYSLLDDRQGSFGDEAINTIIAEMENHRDDVIVIFAGYTDRMQDFIARNEGLRSRLSYILEFQDYTADELYKIFEKLVSDNELIASSEVKEKVKIIIDDVAKGKDYGNGRYVRKLLENAKLNMDARLSALNKDDYSFEELKTLTIDDFNDLENDKVLDKNDKSKIGFAA